MLDLFCVTVEAGLPAGRALGVVGAEFDGPLAREWRRVAAEMALGVRHNDAWRSLGERLPASVRGHTISFWENQRQFFSRVIARPGGGVDLSAWPNGLLARVPQGLVSLKVPRR